MPEAPSNFRGAVESELVCPRAGCHAANRPGTTYCVWDRQTNEVFCLVCSFSGPLSAFQPKEPSP